MRGYRLFTLLVVLTVVAQPMIAPVLASHNETEDCTVQDALVYGFTFGHINNHCDVQAQIDAEVHEATTNDDEQTELDLYSAALSQEANTDSYTTTQNNYLQDTETVAWSKAEVAIAEAYEDGKTEEQARIAAREAIKDYYASHQMNLIQTWNNSILAWNQLYERMAQEAGLSSGDEIAQLTMFSSNDLSTRIKDDSGLTNIYDNRTKKHNTNVTLVNDTKASSLKYEMAVRDDSVPELMRKNATITGGYVDWPSASSDRTYAIGFMPTNDDYTFPDDAAVIIEISLYTEYWTEIVNQKNDLINESDAFVNTTYSDYDNNVINASDVISRNTAMFEYGTQTSNESIGFYDSVGAWAAQGYSTPDLNQTGHFEIEYKNKNHTGFLFARTPPNNEWEAGREYNASNISGPVFLARADGTKLDLSGNFTVRELVDKDGESITNVSTTQYNYKTVNSTELNDKLERLLELQEDLETQKSSGTLAAGGGGSIFGLSNAQLVGGLGAAGVAGYAYMQAGAGGGGGFMGGGGGGSGGSNNAARRRRRRR